METDLIFYSESSYDLKIRLNLIYLILNTNISLLITQDLLFIFMSDMGIYLSFAPKAFV